MQHLPTFLSNGLRTFCLVLCFAFLASPQLASAGAYDDFFRAVSIDDESTVRKLVAQGFDPNTVGPSGMIALHMAIMERAYKVAQVLIDAPGTQWDLRNAHGESPLMLAALRSHRRLVQTLVAQGAEINPSGWTPLHYAVTGDGEAALEITRFLLSKGAKVDAFSPNGTTPLMLATLYGQEDAITLLLQEKANPTLKNNADRTALDLAEGIQREGAKKVLLAGINRWQSELAAKASDQSALEMLRQPSTSGSQFADPNTSPMTKN
jgi:ankyrin repeat protein